MHAQRLTDEIHHFKREGLALLAAKGARTWSAQERQLWDGLMDRLNRIEAVAAADKPLPEGVTEIAYRPRTQQHAAYAKALRAGSMAALSAEERGLLIRNTMSTTTGSQGGYSAPSAVASDYVAAVAGFGAVRRGARRIVTTAGSGLSVPTTDGTAEEGEIVAQNTQAASLDPTFGVADATPHKFGSRLITIPIELLQDTAVDMLSLILERSAERIGRRQNRAFTTGTGSGEPTGFVPAATVAKTGAAGQTTTIIYDDLVDLADSVNSDYSDLGPLEWQFSQTTRRTIRKIKDTAGRPIWQPGLDNGLAGDLLLGYPVNINNAMASPAANAKSLAFGCLMGYVVHDRMELVLMRLEDSALATKGQVGFIAWARADGNLADTGAIKLYQHPAS